MKYSRLIVLIALSLLTGCQRGSPELLQGYVEAEYVYVGAPLGGELEHLHVQRGATVKAGDLLFELERSADVASRDEAALRLQQAQATLADLQKGVRPSELEALRAQIDQANAQLTYAQTELTRIEKLRKTFNASEDELQQAQARQRQGLARVAEVTANLQTAQLGGRADVVEAARHEAQARQAALQRAQWNVDQKQQSAPADGVVFDTLYRVGEQVPANRPVVALLPPENIKVRVFVPEPQAGKLRIGSSARITADGINGAIDGSVKFISPSAEYTPPVIYSRDSRTKLVYMIEIALPDEQPVKLRPGQPVDVELKP